MISSIEICPQSESSIATKQMLMGVENVSTYQSVTHYINVPEVTHPNNPSIYSVWNYNDSTSQYYLDNTLASSSITTVGPADYTESNWPGFNWDWLYRGDSDEAPWGLGFYKVTNNYNSSYFYLDTRDAEFNTGTPDFYAVITQEGEYEWQKPQGPDNGVPISNGEIVRSWDILNNTPNTSPLVNYWSKALIALTTSEGNPRLAWGPYSNNQINGYKIYRSKVLHGHPAGSYTLIAQLNNSTWEYTDDDFEIYSDGRYDLYYKIAAYTSTSSWFTNVVKLEDADYGSPAFKNLPIKTEDITYSLDQNYPNPFNPSTRIKYSLAEKTNVKISIFNIMGQEVARLVDEVKEAGEYSVSFNASDLPSGVYIYSINTDKYSKNRKMILMK